MSRPTAGVVRAFQEAGLALPATSSSHGNSSGSQNPSDTAAATVATAPPPPPPQPLPPHQGVLPAAGPTGSQAAARSALSSQVQCPAFATHGSCAKGDRCHLAHGQGEAALMRAVRAQSRAARPPGLAAAAAAAQVTWQGSTSSISSTNSTIQSSSRGGRKGHPAERETSVLQVQAATPPTLAQGPSARQHRPNMMRNITACRHYEWNGRCPYGDSCMFAHGEHELRRRPPPGSEQQPRQLNWQAQPQQAQQEAGSPWPGADASDEELAALLQGTWPDGVGRAGSSSTSGGGSGAGSSSAASTASSGAAATVMQVQPQAVPLLPVPPGGAAGTPVAAQAAPAVLLPQADPSSLMLSAAAAVAPLPSAKAAKQLFAKAASPSGIPSTSPGGSHCSTGRGSNSSPGGSSSSSSSGSLSGDDCRVLRHFHSLHCPITLEPFTDPVVAADGNVYERRAIEEWLYRDGHDTSPLTNERLPHKMLVPCGTLRRCMEEVLQYVRSVRALL